MNKESSNRKISLFLSKDTKSLIHLLKRFEEEVKVKSIIHFETYKYFQRIYYILNYPALFISFMINSALFTRMIENNESNDIFLFGNIITIACNIIIGLVSYYKVDDRMNTHLQYSKEYTRIYRIICQFYYENLVMKEQLKKEILFYFLENIKSHIFLLIDDEPKCPSNIVHNVKIKNVDICFYVYSSKNLNNPYSYDNVLKLYQLPNSILTSIMNEVQTNPQIHIKYPGFYRFDISNENSIKNRINQIPKKDILNYIILEKNISYNDLVEILKNNKEFIKTIHTLENDYEKILVNDIIDPECIVINVSDINQPSNANLVVINNFDNNIQTSSSNSLLNINNEIPQNIPKNINCEIPQNIPKNINCEIPQNIPKNIPQNIPQNIPKNINCEIPQNINGIKNDINKSNKNLYIQKLIELDNENSLEVDVNEFSNSLIETKQIIQYDILIEEKNQFLMKSESKNKLFNSFSRSEPRLEQNFIFNMEL